MLSLNEYRTAIDLDGEFIHDQHDYRSTHELLMLAFSGLDETYYSPMLADCKLLSDTELERLLYVELMHRKPRPLTPQAESAIATLLQRQVGERGRSLGRNLSRISEVVPATDYGSAGRTVIYRGDIRQLEVDAVVNAAMPSLIGCDIPLHNCIDAVLHAQAGPWMRNDCAEIMRLQGTEVEEPGNAKITRAYCLPSRYVLHTVGPHVEGGVITDREREVLRSCYTSCLDLAAEKGDIKSVSFCAISTGRNGFPIEDATHIALDAVNRWLRRHPSAIELVLFNVLNDEDLNVYINALTNWIED